MDLNLDQLAQETIHLSKNFKAEFDRQFDGHQLDLLDDTEAVSDDHLYHEPEGPGLAFRIEKGGQTFCIRAALVDKIEYLPKDLEHGDRRLFKALRIDEIQQLRDVYTFETETLEMAEVIMDQFCNRRFPYHEEDLFNISDPGFSWWLQEGPGSLQISFQSPGVGRRFSSIGPLGDSLIAFKRFQTLFHYLQEQGQGGEFIATARGISMNSGRHKSELFDLLRGLIVEGRDVLPHLKFDSQFQGTKEYKTIILYLRELSFLRQFWLEIVDRL